MEWYMGIDLSKNFVQISCFQESMDEPETISQIPNAEKYLIPTCLCKKRGVGQWFFGEEAKQLGASQEYIFLDDIYERALKKEKITLEGEELDGTVILGLYLQKLIGMAVSRYHIEEIARIVFTVRQTDREIIELTEQLASYLPISKNQVSLQDYKESFYEYALNAPSELHLHDVVLFDYTQDGMYQMNLEMNHHTQPRVVTVKQQKIEKFGVSALGFRKKDAEKDEAFEELLREKFQGKIISCVYLIGEGFDGNWMKESTRFLCQGRRVFLGKNLYTKGACYAARGHGRDWPYVFLGEAKTKANVCLQVFEEGKSRLITLVSAGENWYETNGSVQVILEEGDSLEVLLKAPDHSAAKTETLPLPGLPKRPERTTRLLVEAWPESQEKILIRIRDLGFGEFFKAVPDIWEYRIVI